MEKKADTCINCSNEVSTRFCPQCGQPHPPVRMSIGQMLADFQGRMYGVNGLFPRTIKHMMYKPGEVARTYISGNRVLYTRPIGYFLLMITIMLLLADILSVDYAKFLRGLSQPVSGPEDQVKEKINQVVFQFMSDHVKIIYFAVVPVQAFAARYLFFRKSGFSYLEHTVLPFYIEGHMTLVTILGIILFKVTGIMFPFWIMMGVSIFYFGFAYRGLMINQSKIKAFLKGVGVFIVSNLLVAFVASVAGLIYVFMHPELVKQLIRKGAY